MANYINHRLSARASREFRRVAVGKTDITPLRTGGEIRNAAWKFKQMKFSANYALLTQQAQEEITSAFYAANGPLYLFRYRDYGDFRVVDSPLTVNVGTTDPVQLTKRYYFGPAYADRMLQAVVKATVKDAGGTVISGTLDTELGLFTPTLAWPAGVPTWSGTFDVWVRFDSDEFDMTMHTLDIATTDIELVERRAYS
jgi:uncharacterized protein (TIGR02217 family)